VTAMITKERLSELLDYDKSSGVFTWKKNMRGPARKGDVAGFVRKDGYVSMKIDGKKTYAHRMTWLYMFGIEPNCEIDHIDHDPSNNRIENLRLVSSQGNRMNASRGSKNKSGVVGVQWSINANKWCAQIRHNKKTRHIGYFLSIKDAAIARKQAEQELGFHPNHGATKK
jgi:hypothetical protein